MSDIGGATSFDRLTSDLMDGLEGPRQHEFIEINHRYLQLEEASRSIRRWRAEQAEPHTKEATLSLSRMEGLRITARLAARGFEAEWCAADDANHTDTWGGPFNRRSLNAAEGRHAESFIYFLANSLDAPPSTLFNLLDEIVFEMRERVDIRAQEFSGSEKDQEVWPVVFRYLAQVALREAQPRAGVESFGSV